MVSQNENLSVETKVEVVKLPKKAVVVLSGGLDSTTLLHYVVKELECEVYPISFHYGQRHNVELEMAKWQVSKLKEEGYNIHDLKIVDMGFMKELLRGSSALVDDSIDVPDMKDVENDSQPITYVPYRNLMMLSIALSYAEAVGAEVVFYGAQRQDEYGYWDTTMEFIKRVNEVSMLNREHKIRIVAPFVNLNKAEEIVIGKELSVDYSKTWSCYVGLSDEGKACGKCPSCVDRITNFAKVGIKDPMQYENEIDWDKLIKKYKKEIKLEDVKNKILEALVKQLS